MLTGQALAVQKRNATGRGSGKKIELYGIKKLRELILDLAVRGKLVPQNPADEPASVLLEKVKAEKELLIKEKKINKPKKLSVITDEQKTFSLTDNLAWVQLGDITNYGTCDKAEPDQVNNDIWILELEDAEKETSKLLQKIRFSERKFKSSKNVFRKGDIVYGKLRPYLDKVLIADEDGECTTEMIPFRAYRGRSKFCVSLNSKFLIRYPICLQNGLQIVTMLASNFGLALSTF